MEELLWRKKTNYSGPLTFSWTSLISVILIVNIA